MRFNRKIIIIIIGVLILSISGIIGGKIYMEHQAKQEKSIEFIKEYVTMKSFKEVVASDDSYISGTYEEIREITIDYSNSGSFGHTAYVDPMGDIHAIGYINNEKALSFEITLVYDKNNSLMNSRNYGEIDGWNPSIKLDEYLSMEKTDVG